MPKDIKFEGKIYRVPDDATPDEIDSIIKGPSAVQPSRPADTRGAIQVMQDQAADVVRGAVGKDFAEHPVDTITNALAAFKAAPGEGAWNALTGALKGIITVPYNGIKGAINSGGTAVQNAAAYVAPGTFDAATEEENSQAAQGAGQFAAAVPVIAGEVGAAKKIASGLKNALPSTVRAGAELDKIKAAVGGLPQDMTKASDIAARARELQLTGHGSMPPVATAVERRTIGPTALGAPPVSYSEGFDMASAASKLSASEKMAMKGQMPAQVKRLAGALRESNRDVAVSAGLGDAYDAAISEYSQASKIREIGQLIKKYGPAAVGATGVAGIIARKYLQ